MFNTPLFNSVVIIYHKRKYILKLKLNIYGK